ncbi:Sjogren's syndrome/scleroderma autoantigen 1 family protein [Archaeoglobus neptunius]|uniref:Sjogren's syndrome/scleroderma autoantigen 1 family protein n=1 Tax=Archaeoglobus neptunius TaxID=2798580 RepID=UPI00192922E4
MSDKKISEKGISDAAELLYKGAKMLAYNCPDCKLPLFELNGKIFCASCGKEAVIEEKEEAEENIKEETPVSVHSDITKKIEMAMSKICDMIVESKDVGEVKELADSLEKLAEVVKKLR